MPAEPASQDSGSHPNRVPPHSHEAEQGVIGCILLDADRVLDLCIERKLSVESFHIPVHRVLYEVLLDMSSAGDPVDQGQPDAAGAAAARGPGAEPEGEQLAGGVLGHAGTAVGDLQPQLAAVRSGAQRPGFETRS